MFEEFLSGIGARLSQQAIPYMIIGGQAVLLYGEPRMTRDIDVTLGLDTDHLRTLLDVVQHLALKPLPDEITAFVKETVHPETAYFGLEKSGQSGFPIGEETNLYQGGEPSCPQAFCIMLSVSVATNT